MISSLIEFLKTIKDFRKEKGKRHPLWLVLLTIILGMAQGHFSYRALGDFSKNHKNTISYFWDFSSEEGYKLFND